MIVTDNQTDTSNLRVVSQTPLIAPRELKQRLPADERVADMIVRSRQTIEAIIAGRDRRLLALVGPCSIHDSDGALEYARSLATLHHALQERLYIVMRVYFEKPRTRLGWRGLILDPHLNGSYDVPAGLHIARDLLLRIAELGLPAGTEFLDPIVPQYIDDLVSWAAVGARTIESQTHREMASGLSMPVGFKNGTDGGTDKAIDALASSRQARKFIGIDQNGRTCVIGTEGNPCGHVILRGGGAGPNFNAQSVAHTCAALRQAGLPPMVMIDCSHGNSGKDYRRQERVMESLLQQRNAGNRAICGCMLESNHEAGRQDIPVPVTDLRRGVSITDGCLDWPASERLLRSVAERLII